MGQIYEFTATGLQPINTDDGLAIGQRVYQAHRYEEGVICEAPTQHQIGYTVIYPDGSESQGQRLDSRSPFTRITLRDGIESRAEVARLIALRNAKRISDRTARDEAQQKKAIDAERIAGELKAKYPWAKTANASANIKKELSLAYPGVKFSVRYKSFSGGDSVTIRWMDGPTTAEVDKITDKYEDGQFNGMEDIYEYDQSAYGDAVSKVLGRAKYVSTSRSISARNMKDTALAVCMEYGHDDLPLVKEGSHGDSWVEGGNVPLCGRSNRSLQEQIHHVAHETSFV